MENYMFMSKTEVRKLSKSVLSVSDGTGRIILSPSEAGVSVFYKHKDFITMHRVESVGELTPCELTMDSFKQLIEVLVSQGVRRKIGLKTPPPLSIGEKQIEALAVDDKELKKLNELFSEGGENLLPAYENTSKRLYKHMKYLTETRRASDNKVIRICTNNILFPDGKDRIYRYFAYTPYSLAEEHEVLSIPFSPVKKLLKRLKNEDYGLIRVRWHGLTVLGSYFSFHYFADEKDIRRTKGEGVKNGK